MAVAAVDAGKWSGMDDERGFGKADEHAGAGRYDVTLANGIGVSVAATQRAAVHRYTGAGAGLFDLAKALEDGRIDAATITGDDAAREVTGQLHHAGGMWGGYGGYPVYFVARAAVPWTSHQVW